MTTTDPTDAQQGGTLHEPPRTLDKLFCPKCGQTDGVRSLKTRHYSRGSLCDGTPITITYTRAAVAGPRSMPPFQTLYAMFEEWRTSFPVNHRPESGSPETEQLIDAWIAGFAKHNAITCAATASPAPAESAKDLPNAPEIDPSRKCWASTTNEVCINPRACDDRGCQLFADKDYIDKNTSTNKELRDQLIAAHAAPPESTRVAGEQADVAYPCIVDKKTLFACLQTAEQVFRNPDEPTRLERFRRTKAKLFAQAKASHLPPVTTAEEVRNYVDSLICAPPMREFERAEIERIISKHFAAAPADNDAESLLLKIATIADIGSAEEFGDALERLQSIRELITATTKKGDR